jgi:PPE-repeat protein
MYGYAASSATASMLSPFTSPPNTTTPDGESGQFSAVAQAVATPANNSAQTTMASQLGSTSALTQAAPQVASSSAVATTASATSSTTTTAATAATTTAAVTDPSWWQLTPPNYTTIIKQTLQAYFGVGLGNFGFSIAQQLTYGPGGETAGAGGAWFPTPQFATLGLGNLGGGVGAATHLSGAGVSAAAGQATQVGTLSVPHHWATLTSAANPMTVAEVEETPVRAVAATGTQPGVAAPGNAVLRGVPAGGAGRRTGAGYVHKYGFRYSVLTRPPSAG